MIKIDQIEAASNSAASVGLTFTQWMYADAQMNKLLTPTTILKMCAVIKAAKTLLDTTAVYDREDLDRALQELNDDQ